MKIYRTVLREEVLPYSTEQPELVGQEAVKRFCIDYLKLHEEACENIYVFCLDTKLHIKGLFQAGLGGTDGVTCSVREIFAKALMAGASQIVMVHNHPSGDPMPSGDDIKVTEALSKAGKILQCPLLDHIIIGAGGYRCYSFIQKGEF